MRRHVPADESVQVSRRAGINHAERVVFFHFTQGGNWFEWASDSTPARGWSVDVVGRPLARWRWTADAFPFISSFSLHLYFSFSRVSPVLIQFEG